MLRRPDKRSASGNRGSSKEDTPDVPRLSGLQAFMLGVKWGFHGSYRKRAVSGNHGRLGAKRNPTMAEWWVSADASVHSTIFHPPG